MNKLKKCIKAKIATSPEFDPPIRWKLMAGRCEAVLDKVHINEFVPYHLHTY